VFNCLKVDLVFNFQKVDLVCQKTDLVAMPRVDLIVRHNPDLVDRTNIKGKLGHEYEIVNGEIKAHNSSNCSRHGKGRELNGKI